MTHLNQIAMSVTDLPRTHAWYRQAFGFVPAGGTSAFKGYLAEKVQGVKGAASTCWWLVDQQDYFQLELFEFSNPETRPLPDDWRLCDIGYGMVGLHVADFDVTLARLTDLGTQTLTDPLGDKGFRRVCVRDPEGVLLEIMEDDPRAGFGAAPVRPGIPVTTRSITVSVQNLEKSRHFFVDVLGLETAEGVTLHTETHELLWGLDGARRESVLLWAGEVLVELVQYLDPIGKPQPENYRISDQGLLNIALGFRSKKEFDRVHQRCLQAGLQGNWWPLNIGAWSVVYVNDEQGFSVELLFVRPWYDRMMGFTPKAAPKYKRKKRMKTWNTAFITGGGSGIGRRMAEMLLAEGTSVAVFDLNSSEEAEAALTAIAAGNPGTRCEFFRADVSDAAGLEAVVLEAVGSLGAPDFSLNCAGIQIAKPFAELMAEEFERVVTINLVGSRNFAAAVLPHMQTGSQLALIASLAGLVPGYHYAAYNASKFGVVGLAGALRLEYIGKGIEVSAVCPPEVVTPMVLEERKTMTAVGAKLKSTAGSLELQPACDSIMKQLKARRFMVIPGVRAKLVAISARLFPGVLRWFSERMVVSLSRKDTTLQ
jgi:NAD(P)-dependent dehydrogenase (short-subunit alcohol dehydrogenase family)/catechol 2,3-dioxygenase-like lactoylglutathione lyase family enzyme